MYLFNPSHDSKRWVLTAITDEERERQRDQVSCPKLLQQDSGQAEGRECIQILQKDRSHPGKSVSSTADQEKIGRPQTLLP